MAYTGIFCTLGEITLKVGENKDATGFTEANYNDSISQAESMINVLCKYNFSDNYAGLNADVKRILSEAAASWAAIDFISYNMAGYTSRVEAEDMVSILWAKFKFLIKILQEQDKLTYMKGA